MPFLAARYLAERGIASLRLYLYDFAADARNLIDCTLDSHASDLDAVISYIRQQKTPKVFAVGHSYGGLTILKSTQSLDGVVLWDPTHGSYWIEHSEEQDPNFPEIIVDKYLIGLGGYGYVKAVKAQQYDRAMGDTTKWAAHKGYPLQVISAGKGAMTHLGKRYIDVADQPKLHTIIDDASHQFDDSDEIIQDLSQQTYDWLQKA